MRSIMKSKYSVPAYVASALLGAVALMAFYESPISPLPVPALPESPVGRFPPEMPNISPNIQVPFRMNQQRQQQQQYNQRAFSIDPSGSYMQQQQQQPAASGQQQSVLFPGSAAAQVRSAPGAAGPVQQLAASLLGGAKQQNAQRKSGADYDAPTSRSLFGAAAQASSGSSGAGSANKLSVPVNQQQKGNSLLSFFGLGASSAAPVATATSASGQTAASGISGQTASPAVAAVASALSGSHLVNKVKSYFRPAAAAGAANPYDQYSRMSFAQALLKDSAYLPSLLAPTRKSSTSSSSSSASSSSSPASKLQQSLSHVLATATRGGPAAASSQQQVAAARMQVDQPLVAQQYQQQQQQQPLVGGGGAKRVSAGGNGLVRAADRIAHALLDTFIQRQQSAQSALSAPEVAARKSGSADEQSALVSATSFLSDIMSGYSAPASQAAEQQAAGKQQAEASQAAPQQQPQESRSEQEVAQQQSTPAAPSQQPQQASAESSSTQQQQQHVRKTRSIGFEYPTTLTEQASLQAQQPSKAAQINNLVDFVSDSYNQNKLLFNFVMNQVGLSQALPYVEQFLGPTGQATGGNSLEQLYN